MMNKRVIILLVISIISIISVMGDNNYFLVTNGGGSNSSYSPDQCVDINCTPMFEGIDISPNGALSTMTLRNNTITSLFFSHIKIQDSLWISNGYGIKLNDILIYDWNEIKNSINDNLTLNGTTITDWSQISGTPYNFNYSHYIDQPVNTTSIITHAGATISKNSNALLSVKTDTSNDAFFQLMENSIDCGTTGASGFRNTFDGGANLYKLSRCSGTTIADIYNVQLSNGYIGFGTTAPTDPVTFNQATRFVTTVKFGSGTSSAPIIAHRADENTGINFPSTNDQVDIITGGTTKMEITDTQTTMKNQVLMKKNSFINFLDSFPKDDTTPDVNGGNVFTTYSTYAQNITDFDRGLDGQIITIICTDTNTEIQDNSNLKLAGNFICNSDDTLQLVSYNERWYEISRSDN